MALKQRYQVKLIAIIHKHLPQCKIYLFGSRAYDNESAGSDIDIALDAGTPIPYKTLLKILVDFDETIIPMKIDLVDLQTASGDLKNEILKKGILWTG